METGWSILLLLDNHDCSIIIIINITNNTSIIIHFYEALLNTLEDKFWPPAAVAVNVQSLLHANSRYLRDIPPASASSLRH